MEAAGKPEVECEIHDTQGLREGVQPHHIFIHQYFITRGSALGGGGQLDLFTLQPTNQNPRFPT